MKTHEHVYFITVLMTKMKTRNINAQDECIAIHFKNLVQLLLNMLLQSANMEICLKRFKEKLQIAKQYISDDFKYGNIHTYINVWNLTHKCICLEILVEYIEFS